MFRPPSESVDIVDLANAEKIKDGDELRNINSFEYLVNIANKIVLNNPENHVAINAPNLCAPPIHNPGFSYALEPYQIFYDIKKFFNDHEKDEKSDPIYESRLAYGNIYTTFLQTLEIALPIIEAHRNQMFFQCLDYRTKISQNSKVVEMLGPKIKLLEDYIVYYKDHPEELQYDSRYKTHKELDDDLLSMNNRLETLKADIETSKKLIEIINTFLNNFDQMIDKIYANENHGLERSAHMVASVIKGVSQTSKKIEEVIRERLKGNSKSKSGKFLDSLNFYTSYRDKNKTTPQNEGSLLQLGISFVNPSFKPLKKTSMPSIREYDYKKAANGQFRALLEDALENDHAVSAAYPIECRMGTQAEYHRTHARISPIFECWLRVQQRKREAKGQKQGQTRITHIYFNNLPIDRDSVEGKKEIRLTQELHELEKRHNNIAVITLPADHGLMDHHFLEHHQKTMKLQDAFTRMLAIASGKSDEKVKDFYISEPIKKLLYGGNGEIHDQANETAELTNLLTNSFQTLGFSSEEELSEAELQAVYFHFIKFELTDFIIRKLQPDSFNMSCKDGIDRGGVSSAYYNLMKSIETNSGWALSEEEFICALHGAPTMVKGRGMNHHSRLIWNAIDAYVDENINNATVDMPAWLIEWRNENAPPHTKPHYINELKSFIEKHQQTNELTTVSLFKTNPIDNAKSISTAKKMLALIENPHPAINPTHAELACHDKDLIKLRMAIEKDYLFNFSPLIHENQPQTIAVY